MSKIYNMLEELRPEYDFKESQDYIEEGLLDSFDLITLINMIEEEYNIVIDGLDVVPENFCNVEAIETLVKKSGGKI